jgi:hypothetical protein
MVGTKVGNELPGGHYLPRQAHDARWLVVKRPAPKPIGGVSMVSHERTNLATELNLLGISDTDLADITALLNAGAYELSNTAKEQHGDRVTHPGQQDHRVRVEG